MCPREMPGDPNEFRDHHEGNQEETENDRDAVGHDLAWD